MVTAIVYALLALRCTVPCNQARSLRRRWNGRLCSVASAPHCTGNRVVGRLTPTLTNTWGCTLPRPGGLKSTGATGNRAVGRLTPALTNTWGCRGGSRNSLRGGGGSGPEFFERGGGVRVQVRGNFHILTSKKEKKKTSEGGG